MTFCELLRFHSRLFLLSASFRWAAPHSEQYLLRPEVFTISFPQISQWIILPSSITWPALLRALHSLSVSRLRSVLQDGQYRADGPPVKVRPQLTHTLGRSTGLETRIFLFKLPLLSELFFVALCVLIEELLVCTRCKLVVNLLADLIVHIHYSYLEINLNTILVYYHFSHFFILRSFDDLSILLFVQIVKHYFKINKK
nr:MAG TPA: hypothetical protein [Bacteriophage sp.]